MRTTEPTEITQGEAIEWTRSFSGFPADEWTLQYRFRSSYGTGFNVDASVDGDGFAAVITAANSATMATGKYLWQAWVTEIADSTNTEMIDEGETNIERGFAAGQTGTIELRSPAKQAYDALFAALQGSATSDQLEFEVSTPAGSTRVKHMSRKDMTDLLAFYVKIVRRENLAERLKQGGKFTTPINVRVKEC